MSTVKFEFSKKLASDLARNGKSWETLLFKACTEAKNAEIKTTDFCDALRASGFRAGTGPARAAYKAVKDGGDFTAMKTAIDAVKAKRKADAGKADAGTTTEEQGKGTDTGTDTLVGALSAACAAAKNGHLEVVESWIVKASAILAAAKTATAQAVERMGGVAEKAS